MKIIIVTGKSGSGKSEVAKILSQKLNLDRLSLDEVSHLSLQDTKIKHSLTEKFGKQIFVGEEVDRKKLGEIIFKDKSSLEFVNNLSWKFIDEFVDNKLSNINSNGIILDYALLPKMKYFKMANFKILVKAEKDIRLSRLAIRDKKEREYLELREENSLEFCETDYDFIIDNTSLSKQELEEQVEKLAKKIQI